MPLQLPITNHSRVAREGARKGGLEYGADTSLLFCVGVGLGGERGIFKKKFICFVGCFFIICFVFCFVYCLLVCFVID